MTSSRRALSRILAVALAALLTMTLFAPAASARDRPSAGQIRDRLERLVNQDRDRADLPRIRVHRGMQRHARRQSRQMAKARALFHDPRLSHEVPRDARMWGENIGRTAARQAPRHIQRLFMASAAHRANVLRRGWTHMGIGVYKRGAYVYFTQRYVDRR